MRTQSDRSMDAAARSLASIIPDIDAILTHIFKGTSLLQGHSTDYLLSLAIAVAFPFVRLVLDKSVYDVSHCRSVTQSHALE